jgi:hypothetical protein
MRSMPGELPRLNRWYWPSLSEARSRGCSRACSSCSVIARGRSPSTQAATASTNRCSRGVILMVELRAASMKGRALPGASPDSANMCSAAQQACTSGLESASATCRMLTTRASQAMKPSTKSFSGPRLSGSARVTALPRISWRDAGMVRRLYLVAAALARCLCRGRQWVRTRRRQRRTPYTAAASRPTSSTAATVSTPAIWRTSTGQLFFSSWRKGS